MASARRSRRRLLGGVLAAVGLAGTGAAARFTLSDGSVTGSGGSVANVNPGTLYLDRYTMHTGGSGIERHKGDQSLLRGTLLTDGGEKAGELFASSVTMPGPLDDDSPRTPRMEMQTLNLLDGAIMAMGTVFAHPDIPNIYTVIGGTGRYAGVSGSYTFEGNPNVAYRDGRATVNFNLKV